MQRQLPWEIGEGALFVKPAAGDQGASERFTRPAGLNQLGALTSLVPKRLRSLLMYLVRPCHELAQRDDWGSVCVCVGGGGAAQNCMSS